MLFFAEGDPGLLEHGHLIDHVADFSLWSLLNISLLVMLFHWELLSQQESTLLSDLQMMLMLFTSFALIALYISLWVLDFKVRLLNQLRNLLELLISVELMVQDDPVENLGQMRVQVQLDVSDFLLPLQKRLHRFESVQAAAHFYLKLFL